MRLMGAVVLMGAVASATVFADDKEKPKIVVEKKSTTTTTASKEVKVIKVEEKKGGNKFTRFWTDDVGGTIYRGLKKGSSKIANAFD